MEVITGPELAAETGYDISTICRWARAGHLPSIRKLPGRTGAWLFDPAVVRPLVTRRPPAGEDPATPQPGQAT